MSDTPTVAGLLAEATAALTSARIDTPRLDAQLIMAWVLKCRREDLAREPEQPVSDRDTLVYRTAVSLRALRRPLPYITGEQVFYGRSFKINRAVLIPRPETELLVAAVLKKTTGFAAPHIVDVGTGSGCIAVTIACERPTAHLWGTDLSRDALKIARKNIVRYGLQDRVTLLQGDLLEALAPGPRFDVIVSNPPYVAEHEMPALQPEVRDYEPPLALVGITGATGADGTGLYERIFFEASRRLKPSGWLILEVGHNQAEIVANLGRVCGYTAITVTNDYAKIPRVVLAQWPRPTRSPTKRSAL